jgi:Na+/proline symporter
LLAGVLFDPLITGFLLAALLAAIMSTISSQLLVSSSSLTEDFYRIYLRRDASQRELVTVGRICVLLVALWRSGSPTIRKIRSSASSPTHGPASAPPSDPSSSSR